MFRPTLLWLLMWGAAIAQGAVDGGPGASPAAWKHPADWYPPSVRRWFEGLPPGLQYSAMRFRVGDDPRWARPDWDDREWEIRAPLQVPARTGVQWYRLRVRMGEGDTMALPPGIMLTSVMAYELFWDGVRLGGSGEPAATREGERPGRVDQWFSIPTDLAGPGEHVVALRASSFRVGFPAPTAGFRLLIDAPEVLQAKVLREAFVPTIAAGALFMTGLAGAIMWLVAARRGALLLLTGLCLAASAMQSLQALRWFFPYPADWHYGVTLAMSVLVGFQAVLTVAFEVEHFAVPRGRWLALGFGAALALIGWLAPARASGSIVLGLGVFAAVACGGWAWRRGRRGALPVFIGMVLSALLLAVEAEDYRASFFLKFFPGLVGLIIALALQLNDERRRAQEAQLASARLEIELLKKNFQPHFLLNTLAVLGEIVERDPPSAVKLIEDLADEFRSVARMAAEKLIPLGQELELCRAHLRVMSARTGRAWRLETEGVEASVAVSPAVFLTLIENGFAHQRVDGPTGCFRLQLARRADGGWRFEFWSPGEPHHEPARPQGGTGLRYVRARLEESFPGRWQLTDGPADGGWRTVIELAVPVGGGDT